MRPAALADVRLAHPGVANDLANNLKAEGTSDERRYWQQLLFTAGLKDELRLKVMDENDDNLADCFKTACDHESLLNERRKTFGVTAVSGGEDRALRSWSQDEVDALEDSAFNQVNAIRTGNSLPPLRRSAMYRNVVNNSNRSYASTARTTTGASTSAIGNPMKCRYCKKAGHLQKACFARIRNNAPMVDKDGRPYRVNAVNQGDAGDAAAAATEAAPAPGPAISSVHHLNW
jgi:hypothetical protein